jgi:hypothetical protein
VVQAKKGMSQIFGGLMALAALSGSILAGNEPVRSLTSGAIAGLIGWVLGSFWQGLSQAVSPPISLEPEEEVKDLKPTEEPEEEEDEEREEQKAA